MYTYLCFLALFVTTILSYADIGEVNIVFASEVKFVNPYIDGDQVFYIDGAVLYSYDLFDESTTKVFNFTGVEMFPIRPYTYVDALEIVGDFIYMTCNLWDEVEEEDEDFLISMNLAEQTATVHLFFDYYRGMYNYMSVGEDDTVFASISDIDSTHVVVFKDGDVLSSQELHYGITDFFLVDDSAVVLNGDSNSTNLVVLTTDTISEIELLDHGVDIDTIFYSEDLNVVGSFVGGNVTLVDISSHVIKSYPVTYNSDGVVVVGEKIYYDSGNNTLFELSLVTGVETVIEDFESPQFGLVKNDNYLVRFSSQNMAVISLSDWSIRAVNFTQTLDFVHITNEHVIFNEPSSSLRSISDEDITFYVFALSDLSEQIIVLANTSFYEFYLTNFNNFFVFGFYDILSGFATVQLLDCDAPFGGDRCLFNCDDCMNGGICDFGIEGGICGCEEPYNGTYCEIDTTLIESTVVVESEMEETGDMSDDNDSLSEMSDSGDMSGSEDSNPLLNMSTTFVASVAFTLVILLQ